MARRKQTPVDPEQFILDFTSALNERLAAIRSLERVDCGLNPDRLNGVIELLQRIAIFSGDNRTSNARVVTIATQLTDRRKVTEKTIRNWSRDAKALGLLEVDERSHRFGGHRTNGWSIDYARLTELLVGGGPELDRKRGGNGAVTITAPGAVTISAPGAVTVSALTLSRSVSRPKEDNYSGPGRNGAVTYKSKMPGGIGAATRATGAARPGEPVLADSQAGNGYAAPPDQDPLREELVTHHPLLSDSLQRPVAPLPPGRLLGNVFTPIKDHDLPQADRMVLWFRQQLGVPLPVMQDTEADLLLCLATAIYAATMPAAEVRRCRAAVFSNIVFRRLWRRAIAKVTSAQEALDRVLERWPEALTDEQNLGPRAAPAPTEASP